MIGRREPDRPFPRSDYASLELYAPDRTPVEVDLSDNTNLWGAHPAALEAVRAAADDALARYPELYADALREAVAARFPVGPGNVCTGSGSDDLLDSAFRAASRDRGVVSYVSPSFAMVEPFARMNGHEPVAVVWDDAMDEPERLVECDPVIVYLARPNNPTGVVAPGAWIERLLELVGEDGPLVVVDEAYGDFHGESLAEAAAASARLLVTRTLSKAYGLAGLRIGFGFGNAAVVHEVEKSRGPYKVGRLAQAAALAALADEEGWVERTVAECRDNRARLEEELQDRGLAPADSGANFLFVPVPDGSATRISLGLRKRGVAVRPFPDCPGHGDAIRVTVGPWHLMERFLDALDEVLPLRDAERAALEIEVETDPR